MIMQKFIILNLSLLNPNKELMKMFLAHLFNKNLKNKISFHLHNRSYFHLKIKYPNKININIHILDNFVN